MKNRTIAVIDLKAFYAYVECVDRGMDPWTTPLVVADKSRSVNTIVLSVSPYLKSKGIPSRCRLKELPKGFNYIYATPRMARYIERSSEVVSVLLDFVSEADLHVYSIDEAFLDLTTYLSYYKKEPKEIVQDIINKIKSETGLQATAGIGDNFFLAKVALDIFAKKEKDGIATMHLSDVKEKLWPITPLTEIWGIGHRLCARLNALGIFTVEELANSDPVCIHRYFGIIGDQLIAHANGIDEADVREEYVPKETSLTIGQTLPRNYSYKEVPLLLREMVDDLGARMRSENKLSEVVSLYIGYASNQGGFGRQLALLNPTDNNEKLLAAVMGIYNKNVIDLPIRQISIVFGKLREVGKFEQLSLFEDPSEVEEKRNLQKMIDLIHTKYGKNILTRASALLEGSTAKERHNQIGGHRK